LRSFSINKLEDLSDVILIELISTHSVALRKLSIVECSGFTDVSLLKLAMCCPSLTCLEIVNNDQLTDISLCAVIHACPFLQSLDISNCIHLTHRILHDITHCCRCLKVFKFKGCHHFDSLSVMQFMLRVVVLEYVVVVDGTVVSATGLPLSDRVELPLWSTFQWD
jgi:hypothetical protein